jgi:hypothetical protein
VRRFFFIFLWETSKYYLWFNLLRLACQKTLSLHYLTGLLVVGFKILDSNAFTSMVSIKSLIS